MRALVEKHRNRLLLGGGAVLLLAAWFMLGGGGSAGDEGHGKGQVGDAGATEILAEGYTIADCSWAGLPASPPPEPPPYVSPEDEHLAKELQERLQNMDIAIEGK